MANTIIIGMADLNTGRGGDILTTLGLGSCVGITLYDPRTRIGGLAHIMLPDSRSYHTVDTSNKFKFADTAIVILLQNMMAMGAAKSGIVAKIAGGANMFSTARTDVIKVGQRNVQASREIIKALNLPLIADDTGGTYGRTILLNTDNGELLVKTVGRGQRTI